MKNVLILFGGQSTEHEVSCLSAYSVLKNIDLEKYNVRICGITKKGDWCKVPFDDIECIKDGRWYNLAKEGSFIAEAIDDIKWCDVIFPVMHGIMAEDGTIQGLCAIANKPCVGPNVLSSAVCMDKIYTKILLRDAGIPIVDFFVADRDELDEIFPDFTEKTETVLGFPCFVKPSNSGSSVGAYKVNKKEDFEKFVRMAAKYDKKILVEKFIPAKEVECAVLGNEKPKASTPGEIVSESEFYDYEDKYINGTSSTRIPADISEENRETVRKLAVKAYKTLSCEGLSRVDFFYEKPTGKIYLNEINTLPGFTEISMYAKMWAHDGVDFKTLVTELLELAQDTYRKNNKLGALN